METSYTLAFVVSTASAALAKALRSVQVQGTSAVCQQFHSVFVLIRMVVWVHYNAFHCLCHDLDCFLSISHDLDCLAVISST